MAAVRRSRCTEVCNGTVVGRKKIADKSYMVTVDYTVNGTKYRIKEVSRRRYRHLNLGVVSIRLNKVYSQPDMLYTTSVIVMYNPEKPSEACIRGNVGML